MKNKKIVILLFIFLLLILFFIPIWAFFIEPNLLIIKTISVKDSELKGLRVAFVSDLHICQDEKNKLLKIIDKINNQAPDIILLGGDYIVFEIYKNKSMKAKEIASLLPKLKAKYGIFMVMGNHDSYLNSAKTFEKDLKNSNITILQNANTIIKTDDGRQICVVGIGDFASNRHIVDRAFKNSKKPIISFTHSPDVFPLIPDYANITFAGHTHGGQVYIPFYGPVGMPRHLLGKYIKGFYVEGNKKIFVSSGIGNSHLKVRLYNLPEIIIADFK